MVRGGRARVKEVKGVFLTSYQLRIKLFVRDRVNTRGKEKQTASLCRPRCPRENSGTEAQPLTERGSLINHRACLSSRPFTSERRPVKASPTALIGEEVKNVLSDFIFLTKETTSTSSLLILFYILDTELTHTLIWITLKV